jgi:hypothetical protein
LFSEIFTRLTTAVRAKLRPLIRASERPAERRRTLKITGARHHRGTARGAAGGAILPTWLRVALIAAPLLLILVLSIRQIGSLDIGFHLKAGNDVLGGHGWPRRCRWMRRYAARTTSCGTMPTPRLCGAKPDG